MDASILVTTGLTAAAYTMSRVFFWKGVSEKPSEPSYWNRQYLKF